MVFLIDKKISQTFRKLKRKMKMKIMLQDLFEHNEAIYLEIFMRLVATSNDFKGGKDLTWSWCLSEANIETSALKSIKYSVNSFKPLKSHSSFFDFMTCFHSIFNSKFDNRDRTILIQLKNIHNQL